MKQKRKKTIIILSILLITVLIFLAVILLFEDTENKYKKELESLGREYYENYYYNLIGKTLTEKKDFLIDYTSLGIKIDLDNISRYNNKANKDKVDKFINPKTKKPCDTKNTKVIIYPKENFGKKDYDIKVELECGF